MSVTEVAHPLVQHKLGLLRDRNTETHLFRQLVNELTLLLTYEATKDLVVEEAEVDTPLERTSVTRISGKKVAICPILRAGMGMLDGVLSLISGARVGFIGLYRDEETLQAVEYYVKLPNDIATNIRLIALIAAPEGIAHIVEQHPDVRIVVASIDRKLNEKGYILPGLGDAGDRLYGTK